MANSVPVDLPDESISPALIPQVTVTDKDQLRALSKTFGHIPGVPIFATWRSRIDCSNAAVHRSPMKGICGNRKDGAFSVVLSNSYKDDEDGGETIIYTGSGGRERWTNTFPPKRIRVGPQTLNQTWDDNKALVISEQTRNPVRVVRGWKGNSRYAPVEGFRYDGLYTVVSRWTGKGANGLDICRCRLERLPGQPPIPVRSDAEMSLRPTVKRRKARLGTHVRSSSQPSEQTLVPSQLQQPAMPVEAAISSSSMTSPIPRITQPESSPAKALLSSPAKPMSSSLTRYMWDPKTKEMMKIASDENTGQEEDGDDEDDQMTVDEDNKD
ncbi:PUA-like domain-containing protein [Melanogaster broomeanus]|nr:PUA-like domain-containing protein [Melanogaster broomeanus]